MRLDLLNMGRKSQIQIGETIAVLFVFFILILAGFVFYVKIIRGNIDFEKEESSQLKSIGIAQRVMFLPELECSKYGDIDSNCIDTLKLAYAKNIMDQNEVYYYDLLGFSNVTVLQIYPTEARWELYSRRAEGLKSEFATNVPISLYNPVARNSGFGILTIKTLSK